MEVTKEGLQNLQQKLQALQQKIAEAEARVLQGRTFCDFAEDPTYQQAYDEYVALREQASDMQRTIKTATVVATPNDKIGLGSTVTFCEQGYAPETYQIVTEVEADIMIGKISITSPMAQALIGKQVGDSIEVNGRFITITK